MDCWGSQPQSSMAQDFLNSSAHQSLCFPIALNLVQLIPATVQDLLGFQDRGRAAFGKRKLPAPSISSRLSLRHHRASFHRHGFPLDCHLTLIKASSSDDLSVGFNRCNEPRKVTSYSVTRLEDPWSASPCLILSNTPRTRRRASMYIINSEYVRGMTLISLSTVNV